MKQLLYLIFTIALVFFCHYYCIARPRKAKEVEKLKCYKAESNANDSFNNLNKLALPSIIICQECGFINMGEVLLCKQCDNKLEDGKNGY